MPMNNALNVSELLKRLGVVGDSLGSAPILEELRLVINLADLTDLVPPLATPVAGSHHTVTSGVGTFNQFTLDCRSPGGLTVQRIGTNSGTDWDSWVSDTDPFLATVARPTANLSFGQPAVSIFGSSAPAAKVAPAETIRLRGFILDELLSPDNWVGPGQFFNIEAVSSNVGQRISIMWKEFPAALNP